MGVINFSDMHSCGTNTEVSVPCMFSSFGRRNYDEDKIRSHQSLLHVLERAGITTLWRDNQSGCKGVRWSRISTPRSAQSPSYALMVGVSMRFCLKTYQLRLEKFPVIV